MRPSADAAAEHRRRTAAFARNLAGDRDALLTDYMSRGFDQVRVEVAQQVEPADANKVDVVFHITEGRQIFVRKVLLTGLHYTRPADGRQSHYSASWRPAERDGADGDTAQSI